MRSLKFLLVADFEPDTDSGTSGTILSLGNALKVIGHEVAFEWKSTHAPFFESGGLYRLLELPTRQFRQVTKRLHQETPDVVIVSQVYSYLIYEQLPARYPSTLFLNISLGWEDRVYASRQLWEDVKLLSINSHIARILTHRACKRTAASAHGFLIAASNAVRFVFEHYGIPVEKVNHFVHGLDKEYLSVDLSRRTPSANPRMLYVGNYLPIKGSKVMEDVLPTLGVRIPNLEMTFVVPPLQCAEVTTKYEPFFGSRLKVFTWMDRTDLLNVYLQNDILFFPSLFEGFGKVFFEAMACGLCVMGFDDGGIADVAVNGETAFFCKAGNLTALEALLEKYIREPELYRAAGLKAHDRVKGFSWEFAAAQITGFCEKRRRELLNIA